MSRTEKLSGALSDLEQAAALNRELKKGAVHLDWSAVGAASAPFLRALDRAAAGFAKVLEKHGRYAIYGIASGRTPSEANYTMQQFIRRGYGTHYIDNCSRA